MSQKNNKQQQQKQKKNKPKVVLPKALKGKQYGYYGGQLAGVVKRGLGATLRMYPETINFAEVYTDPFSIKEARLPFLPIYSTKCIRSVVRANGAIGTNGFGFVMAVPMWGAVNDQDSVFYSNATFTGVATNWVGAGISSSPATKISYTKSSFDRLS